MKKKNSLVAAPTKPKPGSTKKVKSKNLSPAKKFRLRLRREKFQKQKQAKDDYYEHDNRDAARNEKKKAGRLNKKGRQAQMYIDAYLKSQHEQRLIRNGDTASYDETQESSNSIWMPVKSIVHRANNIGLSPMTSRLNKEQASANFTTTKSATGNVATLNCCCHCACSVRKKKARRKLSSPYFGDFNRTLSFANSSCTGESEVTTQIHTTMHRETLMKAGDIVNINQLRLPVFNKVQRRNSCGLNGVRSVISLKETHEIAQAQQQKNARLREAFGISDYFVEGTSFDPERKAREELAKSEAIQKEIQAEKDTDKINRKKYTLVRTPSPDKSDSPAIDEDDDEPKGKVDKKKKKKRNRDASSSPDRKKDKKKKSKKHKKDKGKKKKSRKRHDTDSSESSESSDSSASSSDYSSSDDSDSDADKHRRRKKSKKNKKKKSKKKRHESRDRSRDSSVDKKKTKSDRKELKSKDIDLIDKRAPRRDEKVVRKSRSRDRRQRSSSKDRVSSRRSRSRSLRKPISRPDKSNNRSSPRSDRDKISNRRDQRSRSRQKQKERSLTPKKVVKQNSPTPKRKERKISNSPRRRSVSRNKKREESPDKKHNESRNNRRRSPSPRKRSIERKKSATPKLRSPERKRDRSPEKRRARSPSPRPIRRRSPSPRRQSLTKERNPSRNLQRRSLSRNRNRRRSPIARKRSGSKSRSPVPRKTQRYSRSPRNQRGRNHNDRRSRSRSLSYSPARRNPEKYREILDPKGRPVEKSKKPAPVVKLHPTTSDRESSTENEAPGRNKSVEKVEEFLPIDRNQERELDRLKALKSELAAKAKESLEKKIISEIASSSSAVPGKPKSGRVVSPPQKHESEPRRAREMEIVAQTSAISTKEKQAAIKEREDKRKISIKPFKINDSSPPKKSSGETAKIDVSKSVENSEKGRKSRSRSRSIHRSRDGSSSSGSSGSSRSSSGSSSASSRSRSSSGSSHSSVSVHSRPRSRGHSGSIPRRAGSPSFLDRRRITSARKRPIPYHRPGAVKDGSVSGSSRSSSVSSNRSLSP